MGYIMIINHCHYMGGIYYNLKLQIQMMLQKNSPLDDSSSWSPEE